MAASKLEALWNHPAGPKTIFFWAPTFKWGVIGANIADIKKPPQEISYPLQAALMIAGVIWVRYSLVIKPRNWNLVGVNAAMAATAAIQIARKCQHDMIVEKETMEAEQD